jgi:HAD superfamily hydrolase (TIGR01549 family)
MDPHAKLRRARWLFFDMGATLLDERHALIALFGKLVQVAAERGLRVSEEDVARAFQTAPARYEPSWLASALNVLFAKDDDRAFVLDRVGYRADLDEPYPDAVPVLSRLAGRYNIGVIANQAPGAWERLEGHGLSPFVSLCLPSAEVGITKPDPAIFRLALERAQCEPGVAVMIGDRIDNDIRPARQLGWGTIRVRQGLAASQVPRDALDEADLTVSTLSEISDILA